MINKRIQSLRSAMTVQGIDVYIIPSSDAHQSEYVAPHWKGCEWITGFDGSAGTAVITKTGAYLWTDGRYHIQALDQLSGSEVQLMKQGLEGVPTIGEWLAEQLENGAVLGFDGAVVSQKVLEGWQKDIYPKQLQVKADKDLLAEVWTDRPELPTKPAMVHEQPYAGLTVEEKLTQLRKEMDKKQVTHAIVTTLDDLAWLFNIRGADVDYNPVVLCYGLVSKEEAILFIAPEKAPSSVKDALAAANVSLRDYHTIETALAGLPEEAVVLYDPATLGVSLHRAITDSAVHVPAANVVAAMKAKKSEAELKNLRQCQVRDGLAMVHYLKWQDEAIESGTMTELKAAEMLRTFRSKQDRFMGESFNSIVAWKEHGAMMHYRATEESSYEVSGSGFFLFDSGGQYLDGTTDITRTIGVGELTEEMKRDYTLTLVGHIRLNMAKFLYGATGSKLDMLARQPLWEVGLDYKCGTGHGVGYFLNVHEGPQGLRMEPNLIPLEVGHILTNEPGVYRGGAYGIRLENTLVVQKAEETAFGTFLDFEIISLCPLDTKPVLKDLMTDKEIQWLNSYHARVYETLAPHLDEDHKQWLRKATAAI